MAKVVDMAQVDEIAREIARGAAQLQGMAPRGSIVAALARVILTAALELRSVAESKRPKGEKQP